MSTPEPAKTGPAARADRKRRPTLAAIAAEAGVSLPTVSKVVNGRPDVAPDTRALVERLLGERKYQRPGLRRRRRSGLIDLIFNGLDSPWAVEILRGVEDWCSAHATLYDVNLNPKPAFSALQQDLQFAAFGAPHRFGDGRRR